MERELCVEECFSILQYEPSLFCLMIGRLICKNFYEACLLLDNRMKFSNRKQILYFAKSVDRRITKKVVEIIARDCDLGDDDMMLIGSIFNHLQILDLQNNLLTLVGIKHLEGSGSVSSLRVLNVAGISDKGTLSIDAFQNLKVLVCTELQSPKNIHKLAVLKTDYEIPDVDNFPHLKHVKSSGRNLVWNTLEKISKLESLSLVKCKEYSIEAHLSIYNNLKKLRIQKSSLTIPNIVNIAENLNQIESLKLEHVSSSGDEVISKLCDLKVIDRLNTLHLIGNHISDVGIENLISNSNLEKLRSLNMSNNEISEKGVISIAYCPKLSNLRYLSLEETKAGLHLDHFINGSLRGLNFFNGIATGINIHNADDFLQSPFARKLTKCKLLKQKNISWKYCNNIHLLKDKSNQFENLLHFILKEPPMENLINTCTCTDTDIRDVNHNFRVQLKSIDNLLPSHLGFYALGSIMVEIQAEICYGTKIIIEKCSESFSCDYSKSIESSYWFNFSKRLVELPFESVVRINIFILKLSSMVKKQVASTRIPIFNGNRNHTHGIIQNTIYSVYTPIGIKLQTTFDKYHENIKPFEGDLVDLEPEECKELPIYFEDLLTQKFLTDEEKATIWSARSIIPKTHLGLRLLLQSFPFMNHHALVYMRNYVKEIANTFSTPYQYLELLGEPFIDEEIRSLGHTAINQMTDDQLLNSMEIIFNLIGFEIRIDNPIVLTLLNRGLNNVNVGRLLLWNVNGHLHDPSIREKIVWLITQYFMNSNQTKLLEFYNQCLYIYQLEEIQSGLKELMRDNPSSYKEILIDRISSLEFPTQFILPYPPYKPVQRILAENSTPTDSRNKSLIMTYESNGKTGRFLILNRNNKIDNYMTNIMKILSDYWNDMYPNEQRQFIQPLVVPIDDNVYMCEIESKPLFQLQDKNITKQNAWINFGNSQNPNFENNLLKSYTFHAVISYIFKMGDLHNDNIGIYNEGFLTLYDKNSIFWNSKFGLRRRNTFFGGTQFVTLMKTDQFIDHTVRNFNIVSQNSRLIYSLLCEMVQFGWINEKLSFGTIYETLKKTLEPYNTTEERVKLVKDLIIEEEKNSSIYFSNFIHILKFK